MTVKEEETIKKRKAQHALEEIYQSEKKYVDKLNSIVEVSFFLFIKKFHVRIKLLQDN